MRRFRAAPSSAPRAGLNVGVTLVRSTRRKTAAELAVEREPEAEPVEESTCNVPATLRLRFLESFAHTTEAAVEEEVSPPNWIFAMPAITDYVVIDSAGEGGEVGAVSIVGDSVTIPLVDRNPVISGMFVLDMLDADDVPIDERANYLAECPTPDEETFPVITWACNYQQFDTSPGDLLRVIPDVFVNADWQLCVGFSASDEMIAGVLTITATDNWTDGGPYEFGPVEITFGAA